MVHWLIEYVQKIIFVDKHEFLGEIVSQNFLGITANCDDEKDMLDKTDLT